MATKEEGAAHEPVFILAGQSNMAGRCDASAIPKEYVHDGSIHIHGGVVFQICWSNDCNFGDGGSNSNGKWLNLQPQPSPGLGISCFGPEIALATALGPRLYQIGVRRAHFIKFAMGSTNLHSNWDPRNDKSVGKPNEVGYYKQFIEFCISAIQKLEEEPCANNQKELTGLFWLQGESDSSKAKDANSYLANFKNFVSLVRIDLNAPRLQIVTSPVVWRAKKLHVVNKALMEAGNGEVEGCVCIDPLDIEKFGVQPEKAGPCAFHLTADGVCDIGHRMGKAVLLDSTIFATGS